MAATLSAEGYDTLHRAAGAMTRLAFVNEPEH